MVVWRLFMVSGSHAQQSLHAGAASGVQFASHVRDEENVRRGHAKQGCDSFVTRWIILGTRRRVEIFINPFRKIAGSRTGEKQPLGENAS